MAQLKLKGKNQLYVIDIKSSYRFTKNQSILFEIIVLLIEEDLKLKILKTINDFK